MLKKRVLILINSNEKSWVQSKKIWFWESKTTHLNRRVNEFIKEMNSSDMITNIQLY